MPRLSPVETTMIRMVVWVVLMVIWLIFGCYIGYDPVRPVIVVGTLIPWACVAILGWCLFKGTPPVR